VVVVPAASSFGPSSAVVSSSPQDRPSPWTRFRYNMITNDKNPSSTFPPSLRPFRPRQPRAPLPRINYRALRFDAIRSQRPPLASRAACARYRLGRRADIRHVALTKRLDSLEKRIHLLHTHLLHLLESNTLLSPSTLASLVCDIRDVQAASSSCHALAVAAHSYTLHGASHSSLTMLHHSLKPATPLRDASPPSIPFFDG
jgi:hypothetical protein